MEDYRNFCFFEAIALKRFTNLELQNKNRKKIIHSQLPPEKYKIKHELYGFTQTTPSGTSVLKGGFVRGK